jgi:hypothetical protein
MSDRIALDLNAPRTPVSPSRYGIFFEEINHAGEGGLYAEMVQNRDFETTRRLAGTKWAGNLLLTEQGWYERKWFGNALHGWSLVNEGGGSGSIHLDIDHPLNAANPQSMRVEARTVGAPTTDINGTARPTPSGSNPDMGAYENTLGEPLP